MDKDNFNANVDFVRGQADMIVLSALADGDKYGLEILNAIQDRSQGMYSLKQATLYSSLKRLEKNGYVHSYDGDFSNGAKRVYYGLTKQGREHLENDKSYWEFCNFLMSSLISDNKFDPLNEEKPFDPADFRPLTRRNKSAEKVVVKYVYVNQETPVGEAGENALSVNDDDEDTDENIDKISSEGDDVQFDNDDNLDNDDVQLYNEDEQLDNQVAEENATYEENFVTSDIVDEDESSAENSIIQAISEYSESISEDKQIVNVETEVTDETLEIYSDESADEDSSTLDNSNYSIDAIEQYSESQNTTMTTTTSEAHVAPQTQVQDNSSDVEEKLAKIVEDLAEIKERINNRQDSALSHEEGKLLGDTTTTTSEEELREEQVLIDEEASDNNTDSSQDTKVGDAYVESNTRQDEYHQGYEEPRPSPLYQPKRYFDENNEVNYVASFSDMFNSIEDDTTEEEEKDDVEFMTMKEMVYKFHAKGVKIKPYDKKDTMEFYVNRYYYSNKLHLHTSLIIFAVLFVELLFSHLICNRNGAMPAWALLLAWIGVGLYPIARYVIYIIDPTKKTPATFNLKTALLISLLPIITLPIVIALLAFVQFGANVHDYATMERTIMLPICLLFNIPLYFVVFEVLYRTYKYHIN